MPLLQQFSLAAAAALVVGAVLSSASAQQLQAPHGAYLGCFAMDKLDIDRTKAAAQFNADTIDRCMPYCGGLKHTLHIISPSNQCWCSSLIPDAAAQLPDASNSCSNGVAVFYHHKDAGLQRCRLAPVPLEPSSFTVHYNPQHMSFNRDNPSGEPEMVLQQAGPDGIRLVANDGLFKYGQYQVAAMPSGASGVVTAFYVRDTDVYTLANKDSPFSEIDIEMMNGNPAVPHSIWLNSFYKGMSQGETLVKPADYQTLLGLPGSVTTANTFFTLGFSWQPDGVIWSIDGVPLLRRYYDQLVSWTDMEGLAYSKRYRPPDAASHVTFSIWSDGNQTRAFGGRLDTAQSPFVSRFRQLRRILCDQPLPSDPVNAAAALGPAWLTQQQPATAGAGAGGATSSSKAGSEGGPSVPALTDLLPAGKTLVATGSLGSTAGQGQQHCLELERMPEAGVGASRLGVYPCSSRTAVWVFDPASQSLSLSSAGNGCLTALDGVPVVTACQAGAAADPRSQQWALAEDGRLRSKSGLCVGMGGPALKPLLSAVPCGSAKELIWRAGVADLLLLLKPAKPLVTWNPDFGYCLTADGPSAAAAAVPCTGAAPSFYYQQHSQQIIKKDSKLCLTASGDGHVSLSPCLSLGATGLRGQQWSLVNGRHLRSGSGMCIRVSPATAAVTAADCDSSVEARWVFGAGDSPLAGLNPGKTLTTASVGGSTSADGASAFVVDVVMQATQADGAKTSFLGLRSSWGSGITGSVRFKFNTTTGQVRSVGRPDGLCLTARRDLQAVQLARCQGKAGQLHMMQSWSWFAGQLRTADPSGGLASADAGGQCVVKGEPVAAGGATLLALGSCLDGNAGERITWAFGGVSP